MGHPQYQANIEELELTGYISGILAEKYSEIENSQCFLEVDIQMRPFIFAGTKITAPAYRKPDWKCFKI